MRTTINIPDALMEKARARARREGRSFTSLVVEGLRRVLVPPDDDTGARVLPAYGDPCGAPLVDLHDRDAVAAALDADGLR